MANMVQVPSGSGNRYRAPQMRLGRSQFDLSHNHKTTFDVGQLIPYFVAEVLPGDTMTCKLMSFCRIFSPLNTPIMDNIHIGIDFFYVPNRLIWTNWEAFLGAHDAAGAQDTDYTVPINNTGTCTLGDLQHYMGIPLGTDYAQVDVNVLPMRAYGLIYNEWYRDQNIIDEITLTLGDAAGSGVSPTPRKSAKKPDYFTTALPYLQKGDPQTVPMTGSLLVQVDDTMNAGTPVGVEHGTGDYRRLELGGTASAGDPVHLDATTTVEDNVLFIDLSQATGITINALRESAAIQRLLERDARGGTRITELTRAHWGVDVPDYRVQRPEYLGGGSGFINVSPIAQTSTEGGTENIGNLGAIGTGQLRASWAKSFVEHGYVLGILRARGEVSYQQGLDRMWSRSTKYDFAWPELSQLGEQPIYNKELFISNDANDDLVFGYQERYAEMRYKKSLITGKFASDATGAIDEWHLAEDFGSLPALNKTFIEDQTPMSRVQAVTDEPDFIIDGRFDFKVARALPVRPVPTLAPARF